MAKQVSFDIFTSFFYGVVAVLRSADAEAVSAFLAWTITFGSAALSSVLSCITSQPGDVILTEMYKHQGSCTTLGLISNIYEESGILGFFAGLKPRLAHVGAIITSQLAIYDVVKQACGLAATGSH